MAHRHASLINLYLCTKFHSNWRNFSWTDGRTYIRTNRHQGWLLGWLGGDDLKIEIIPWQMQNDNRDLSSCLLTWQLSLPQPSSFTFWLEQRQYVAFTDRTFHIADNWPTRLIQELDAHLKIIGSHAVHTVNTLYHHSLTHTHIHNSQGYCTTSNFRYVPNFNFQNTAEFGQTYILKFGFGRK